MTAIDLVDTLTELNLEADDSNSTSGEESEAEVQRQPEGNILCN
jgi:hypothetical protein